MCVIFSTNKELPGEEYLEAAQDRHPDGIGVAWPSKEKGLVEFRKGLTVKELQKLYPILPANGTVIHFRAASIGGKEKELCHPFPLIPGAPDDMFEGKVPGVLFQNGTWSTWALHMKDGIMLSGEKLDFRTTGFWSDARALAWLVARYGEWILQAYTESQQMRILTMLPNKSGEITRCYWGDWKDDEKGRWRLSNKEFTLPKAKGGALTLAPHLLPRGGQTASGGLGGRSTTTSSVSVGGRGDQYWSDISARWLGPEDWFEENVKKTPLDKVIKGDIIETKGEEPYSEKELVALMCELRALRGVDDGSVSPTAH